LIAGPAYRYDRAMSIVPRWSRWTAIGLASLALVSSAAANVDSAITVGASRTRAANVTLEVYNGRLAAGGSFEVRQRGYASVVIDHARTSPMLVQCSVTPSSPASFVVSESRRAAGAKAYEPTGQAFEMSVREPATVIEFAVTPEHEGDHAYAIRPRDRTSFAIHTCTVQALGASSSAALDIPAEHPDRVTPTRAVSESGELAVVEAEFYKWLGDEVVFDADDSMTLHIGASAPDPVVVRCQLDLDLAEQTTFEIELVDQVDQQAKISKLVEQDGRLSFTLWGGKRARLSNPTHMWIWRSCELDSITERR
jgi:hypothetical protein